MAGKRPPPPPPRSDVKVKMQESNEVVLQQTEEQFASETARVDELLKKTTSTSRANLKARLEQRRASSAANKAKVTKDIPPNNDTLGEKSAKSDPQSQPQNATPIGKRTSALIKSQATPPIKLDESSPLLKGRRESEKEELQKTVAAFQVRTTTAQRLILSNTIPKKKRIVKQRAHAQFFKYHFHCCMSHQANAAQTNQMIKNQGSKHHAKLKARLRSRVKDLNHSPGQHDETHSSNEKSDLLDQQSSSKDPKRTSPREVCLAQRK